MNRLELIDIISCVELVEVLGRTSGCPVAHGWPRKRQRDLGCLPERKGMPTERLISTSTPTESVLGLI